MKNSLISSWFNWTWAGSSEVKMWLPLDYLAIASAVGFVLTWKAIPASRETFLKANLFGIDMSKRSKAKVPEATGVIVGCVFLIVTFLMIPVTFSDYLLPASNTTDVHTSNVAFPHKEFAQLLAALLSIASMLLLGFADDVLDLRWRHKLLLPTVAALPLLVVYYVTTNRTDIVVPLMLRPLLGTHIDLGLLYYIYMGMLAVFCTNAINILAGINGLEVGQSVVIAAAIMIFNLREMDGALGHYHRFSLYFLFPYLGTTLPLLWYNWYPSRVFPGDTFCYFSGMTFAVVAILGHFSKTLLLFFIPQVINFLYSLPQLFRMVPCPRHRLPKYDEKTDTVGMSCSTFKKSEMKKLGALSLTILKLLRLVHLVEFEKDGETYIECNNLTLINLLLKLFGPMNERTLTIILLLIQVAFSFVAFFIRYPLALLFYGVVIA